ncbi:MAG: sigma-70 family RNA polymerase sigma factor [Planctomycetota bacterium]
MTNALLSQVARGELHAVEDCIRRFSGAVWNLARRMSPTEQDAEDAVQEVFVELWRAADRYDPSLGSELTFVMTIARRRLIDRDRRRGRTVPTASLAEPEIIPDQPAEHPAEIADEASRVQDAMDRLRPEQREVLQMSLIQGHSHQQVAERTGLPLGTVKSHARRGLMRVREMLGHSPSQTPGGAGAT